MITARKTADRWHTTSPWLVVVPARLSSTGKRRWRRFETQAAARDYASRLNAAIREHGEAAFRAVNPAEAADAAAARSLLAGSGMSLAQAAALALSIKASSLVASTEPQVHGGTGEATAAIERHEEQTPLALGDAVRMHDEACGHHAPVTRENRRQRLATLFRRNPGLEQRPAGQLTPALLQSAMERAWPASDASFNDCHKHLSALYNWLMRKRLVRDNPVTAIDRRHVREREITALPPEKLRALLRSCRPPTDAERRVAKQCRDAYTRRILTQDSSDCAGYIALCAFAGIRPAEAARIRWGDVNFELGIITVRAGQSKTGGTRHVELHPVLRAWLAHCRPPGAQAEATIAPEKELRWKLRAVRKRAGFGEADPWQDDVLRHSYATYYLAARCGSLEQLQLNMGHSTLHLLRTRYLNMWGVTPEAARVWWSIAPD